LLAAITHHCGDAPHRDESEHEQAKTHYSNAARRLTHSYVLAELIPLCQSRGLPRKGTLEERSDLEAIGELDRIFTHINAMVAAQQASQ
jgi:hypothetical protein